jgi:hypothetical protein
MMDRTQASSRLGITMKGKGKVMKERIELGIDGRRETLREGAKQ